MVLRFVKDAWNSLSDDEKVLASAAVGVVGAAMMIRRTGVMDLPSDVDIPLTRIQEIIRKEARRQGVPASVALLFADLESGFRPNTIGDRGWPTRSGNHRRRVLENPRYDSNPFRLDASRWVSYGLFQLLSPYELWRQDPNADPRILLDPRINARLGIMKIGRLLRREDGDLLRARMRYVCGSPQGCSTGKATTIASRLADKAPKWGIDVVKPTLVSRAGIIASA